MSTFEYNDLYLKCQDTGIYHVFVFDIIDSKKMSSNYRKETQNKMIELMNLMYRKIKIIEKEMNKTILVFENDFVTYESNIPYKGFGVKQEPFLFGDTFEFTTYRDTIDNETIYQIYNHCKKILNINFNFHISDGYYETNDFTKGNNEYFRGYCIDLLSVFHKQTTIDAL